MANPIAIAKLNAAKAKIDSMPCDHCPEEMKAKLKEKLDEVRAQLDAKDE